MHRDDDRFCVIVDQAPYGHLVFSFDAYTKKKKEDWLKYPLLCMYNI